MPGGVLAAPTRAGPQTVRCRAPVGAHRAEAVCEDRPRPVYPQQPDEPA